MLCVVLIRAAITDACSLEIANWISIVIALIFLPAALLSGLTLTSIAYHYALASAFFVGGIFLYAKGLTGGGDVKFLAAVCVWWEPGQLAMYIIIVAILGGVLAGAVILANHIDRLRPLLPWLEDGDAMKQPIPFGIAIAGGALIMFDAIPVLPSQLADWLAG